MATNLPLYARQIDFNMKTLKKLALKLISN